VDIFNSVAEPAGERGGCDLLAVWHNRNILNNFVVVNKIKIVTLFLDKGTQLQKSLFKSCYLCRQKYDVRYTSFKGTVS
jgi:hypothetical protein